MVIPRVPFHLTSGTADLFIDRFEDSYKASKLYRSVVEAGLPEAGHVGLRGEYLRNILKPTKKTASKAVAYSTRSSASVLTAGTSNPKREIGISCDC